jgi:hypothetical protein
LLALKGAIAIAQQHAGVVGTIIRSDNIEYAIAVHIAQGQGVWLSSRAEVCFGTKGAIAIAQKHAGVVGVAICGDDVKYPIAVHIA